MMEKPFDIIQNQYNEIVHKISDAAAAMSKSINDIEFIAVTKTVAPENVNYALSLGIHSIGENRVQEYLSKRNQYQLDGVKIHFIGSLQRNKVRQICDKVDTIDSVNSLALAKEIQKQCEKIDKVMPILIEVNIGDEDTKTGIDQHEIFELLEEVAKMPNIRVEGLMAIPPFSADIVEKRMYCHNMYKLFVDIQEKNIHNIFMERLSMGMSDDYVEAILEGATEVRIGSALFGRRNY